MKLNTLNKLFFSVLLSFFFGKSLAQVEHSCSHGKAHLSGLETATLDNHFISLTEEYDVNFYSFDIALERTSAFISGNVEIHAESVVSELDTFLFELHPDLIIDSVLIDGMDNSVFSRVGTAVIVPVDFVESESFFMQIFYSGLPPIGTPHSLELSGLNNRVSPAWGNQITYSLSQPFGAYLWFPCKQSLTDKADSVYMFVTTDSSNTVASNGLLDEVIDLPEGKKRFEWKTYYPIDYYLISVAVGEYVEYSIYAEPDGEPPIFIQNFIYDNPETLPYYLAEINQVADFMEYYSTLFGPYPFANEKYGQAMAPGGYALEHQTMTTGGAFSNILSAHELAHQWFGNNVTCASWSDLWLNEGFASYAELLMHEEFAPFFIPTHLSENHFVITGIPGGSVWVSDTTNTEAIFDSRLVYMKGAMIIHTMRFLMDNDDVFFQTLKDFQTIYGGGTASASDFKSVAESVSGIDFTDFFTQWYYGEGFPTYSIVYEQPDAVGNVSLTLIQEVSVPESIPYFTNELEIAVFGVDGFADTIRLTEIDGALSSHNFDFPELIEEIKIDPGNWIINEVGSIEVLGVMSNEYDQMPIFPNPAEDRITVRSNVHHIGYRIYNSKGQIMLSGMLDSGKNEIAISSLNSGSYFLVTENEKRYAFSKKIG